MKFWQLLLEWNVPPDDVHVLLVVRKQTNDGAQQAPSVPVDPEKQLLCLQVWFFWNVAEAEKYWHCDLVAGMQILPWESQHEELGVEHVEAWLQGVPLLGVPPAFLH